jgi:hypothetical protein
MKTVGLAVLVTGSRNSAASMGSICAIALFLKNVERGVAIGFEGRLKGIQAVPVGFQTSRAVENAFFPPRGNIMHACATLVVRTSTKVANLRIATGFINISISTSIELSCFSSVSIS